MTHDQFDVDRKVCEAATRGPWWDAQEWFQTRHARQITPSHPGPFSPNWRAKPGHKIRDTWAMLICAPSNSPHGVNALGGTMPPSSRSWEEHVRLNGPRVAVDEYDFAHIAALRWSSIRGNHWSDSPPSPKDLAFICAARTRWPAALDEIARLRTVLHQILSTTSEPIIKRFSEEALR